MSNLKITAGGSFEQEASRRFVEDWRQAERGETAAGLLDSSDGGLEADYDAIEMKIAI